MDRIIQRYEEKSNSKTNFNNHNRPRVITERLDRIHLRLSQKDQTTSTSDLTQQLSLVYEVEVDSSFVLRQLLETNQCMSNYEG